MLSNAVFIPTDLKKTRVFPEFCEWQFYLFHYFFMIKLNLYFDDAKVLKDHYQ